MSEIKHTPGPWTVMPGEINKPYLRIRGTRLGQRYKIANVLMPAYPVVRYQEADETHANARLIAAAPEMIELVEMVHLRFGGGNVVTFSDSDIARFAEVFAKATGSQS